MRGNNKIEPEPKWDTGTDEQDKSNQSMLERAVHHTVGFIERTSLYF
jgi:hypothetical protein